MKMLQLVRNQLRSRRAFSLIELMIVVAIIGILPRLRSRTSNASKVKLGSLRRSRCFRDTTQHRRRLIRSTTFSPATSRVRDTSLTVKFHTE